MPLPLAFIDFWLFAMIIAIIAIVNSIKARHTDPSRADTHDCPRPTCKQSNPAHARFCARCGIPLSERKSPVPRRSRRCA